MRIYLINDSNTSNAVIWHSGKATDINTNKGGEQMKVLTVINFAETRRKFDESGRTVGKFAGVHGLTSGTLRMFLRGALPYTQGPGYEAMVEALRGAGCLVEEEAGEDAA